MCSPHPHTYFYAACFHVYVKIVPVLCYFLHKFNQITEKRLQNNSDAGLGMLWMHMKTADCVYSQLEPAPETLVPR